MTEQAVYLQPAFILQRHNYRETSLIIEALTRDFGRISLLAKGVRTARSKNLGLLQPFSSLAISYIGKGDLKILTGVEILASSIELKGLLVYCGFYINELVSCFLHKYDPHPEVFNGYSECLISLSSAVPDFADGLQSPDSLKIEAALRIFELGLMENVGYGLNLEHEFPNAKPIDPQKKYQFNIESGPIEAIDGCFSGLTLQALRSRQLNDSQVLAEAKILMRKIIDVHLQGKQLKSRTVINQISKHIVTNS